MGSLCSSKWTQVVPCHLLHLRYLLSPSSHNTWYLSHHAFIHNLFRCPKCPEVCSDNLALENHVANHFAEQLDKVFTNHHHLKILTHKITRQNHNRTIQAIPQVGPYNCSKCRKDFKDKEGMRRHIGFAHGFLYELTSLTRSHKDLSL